MKENLQKKLLQAVLIFTFFIILPVNGFGQQLLLGWNTTNNSGTFGLSPWTPETLNSNVETSGLIRGSGIATGGTAANGTWGGSGGWSNNGNDTQSFYFTITPKTGKTLSISSISSATRRSNSGPTSSKVYYSVNGGAFIQIATWNTSSTSGTTGSANSTALSTVSALQNIAPGVTVKFRIVPQGTSGNYYITGGANALRLEGTTQAMANATILPSVTTLPDFGNVMGGTHSAASSFTFDGTDLGTNDVSITAPAEFEISTDNLNWFSGADISPIAGAINNQQVWVRLSPTSAGAKSGNIVLSATGATSKNIAVTGTGVNGILISPATTTLSYTEGAGPSMAFQLTQLQAFGMEPSSTYTFKTSNSPNSNFEVSTNNTDWLDPSTTIITQGGNFTIENPTFYIRLKQGLPTGTVSSETIILEALGTSTTFSSSLTVSGTVTPSSLVAPIATAGTLPTLTSFTANWEAVTGAIEYLLDVSTSENFTPLLNNYDNLVVTGTSKLIEGLDAGTTYYYRVRAKANAVISLNSNIIEIKTACAAVAMPVATDQEFCGTATVNNLVATTLTGAVAKWYDNASDTMPLDPAVVLTTKSYFVTQTTANGCESQKKEVAVTIKTIPALLSANPQTFCEAGTVADLVPAQELIQPEIITETFEDPDWALHQSFSGSYPLSTGIWTASRVSRTATSSSDPYKRISFGNSTGTTQNSHMISPVLNGVKSLTIEATSTITSDKLEISKIVNGVETVIQTFTVPQLNNLVMTLFTVTINDPSDLQIKIAAKPSTGTNYYVALGTLTITSYETQTPIIKWYDVATDGTALATTESLQTGNYYVSQTVDGCESPRKEVAITVNPKVIPNFEAITVCNGSTAPVLETTSPNGITGTWNPSTISNTESGDYIFTPDASECATTQTLSVVITEKIVPDFAPIDDFCSGSEAPVLETTSPNGITGTWNPATISNTESGDYTFTPDASECATTQTLSVVITEKIVPDFAPIDDFCSGSEAPVLETTSPNGITGTWNPATISNTESGDYTFTPDAAECATTQTLSVVVIEKTIPDFAPIDDFCSGSEAPVLEATSPNGITGTWTPATISNTQSGDYIFTPDASECATTQTLSVVVTEKIVPNFAPIADFCSGSEAPVLEATSPNGITGTWNPATISNTESGDYTFTPDAAECATTQTLSVVVIEKTIPDFAPIADFCSGSEAPVLEATSPNGITGTWNPATISNTESGDYTFTPDAAECATTQTLSVVVIEKTIPDFAPIADFCSGSEAPVLEATSPNGITGTWNPATISNTESGDYTFTPDAAECATTQTLSVVVIEKTIPDFASIADFCSGSEAPILEATSPNGITGTWNPATISNTESGDYIFTPDASECATAQTLSVVVIEKTIPDFAPIADFCSGSEAPVLEGTSPNGITGTWSPATISNTESGDYTFTPDAGECAATQTLSIVINDATSAPTGEETQDFNGGDTLSDFVVIGEGIKWYDAPTAGNELSSSDLIVAGAIYYASQTVAEGCGESMERLKIIAGVDLANATFDGAMFHYYPNPVNDFLTITSQGNIDSITVFNLLGQQLITKEVNSTTYRLDVSNLASGTYLIQAISGQNSKAFKVIKK